MNRRTFLLGAIAAAVLPLQTQYEVQTIALTGPPTGGSFTMTFNGETSEALAYNETPDKVQAALEALMS